MTQEIEIEAKSLVTRQAYLSLLNTFHIKETDAKIQKNDYFETPTFSLKQTGSALRIRSKQNTYTFTLKQPHEIGLLETHQTLSKEQWRNAVTSHQLPEGPVLEQLRSLHIPTDQLQHVGCLTTSRIELPFNDGILCFDKSEYFDQVDYEIEFEGKSEEHAQTTLVNLLASIHVKPIPTDNKIKRFFEQKNKLMGE